jgi:hypothetical protein
MIQGSVSDTGIATGLVWGTAAVIDMIFLSSACGTGLLYDQMFR